MTRQGSFTRLGCSRMKKTGESHGGAGGAAGRGGAEGDRRAGALDVGPDDPARNRAGSAERRSRRGSAHRSLGMHGASERGGSCSATKRSSITAHRAHSGEPGTVSGSAVTGLDRRRNVGRLPGHRAHRICRKQERTSSTNSSGCSKAAK
jgi:hypothetical protein